MSERPDKDGVTSSGGKAEARSGHEGRDGPLMKEIVGRAPAAAFLDDRQCRATRSSRPAREQGQAIEGAPERGVKRQNEVNGKQLLKDLRDSVKPAEALIDSQDRVETVGTLVGKPAKGLPGIGKAGKIFGPTVMALDFMIHVQETDPAEISDSVIHEMIKFFVFKPMDDAYEFANETLFMPARDQLSTHVGEPLNHELLNLYNYPR